MKFICILFFSLLSFSSNNETLLNNIKELDFFTLGSCNHQRFPQPHWGNIKKMNPDLMLLMGDNVYSDFLSFQSLEKDYQMLLTGKGFKELTQKVPFIATWDDHDYAGNNEGFDYPGKVESKKLFLKFAQEPTYSDRTLTPGIYTSYDFGEGDKSVRFILLDLRSFRNSKELGYKDLLGEPQWEWLEQKLISSKAKINFIVSSTSVFSRPGKTKKNEKWIDYPKSFKRLMHLVEKHEPSGVFFLSGDRHFGLMHSYTYKSRTFHEFISSGLTHGAKTTTALLRIKYGPLSYAGRNYGSIAIDWSKQPSMTLKIHSSTDGSIQAKKSYILNNNRFDAISAPTDPILTR